MSKIIMGIKVQSRIETAAEVQELLTKYGCSIGTRLGLHVATPDLCSPSGLIILEIMDGADGEASALEKELLGLSGVEVRKMEF